LCVIEDGGGAQERQRHSMHVAAQRSGYPESARVRTSIIVRSSDRARLAVSRARWSRRVCAPWAHGSGNSDSESDGANLVITPHPNSGNDGGCIGNTQMSLSEMGLTVEVAQVVSAASGYTRFTLDDANRYPRMEVTENMLNLGVLSSPTFRSVPYVAADMRWWRLRLDRPRSKIIGEYSADATTWINFGELSNPPSSFRVAIEAGVRVTEPTPGTAVIGAFHLCPPP